MNIEHPRNDPHDLLANAVMSAPTEAELKAAFDGIALHKRPGIDGITREQYLCDLDANIGALAARIRDGTYRPKPVLRVHGRKPGGGTRPIALVSVEDKIVQRATLRRIEPRFEKVFFERSFGRTGGGPLAAADQVFLDLLHHQPDVVVQLDLVKCFESFDHAILIDFLKPKLDDAELALVVQMIKARVSTPAPPAADAAEPTMIESVRDVGIEQGMPIAPFLANVFLHFALDEWLQGHSDVSGWARFVDDTIVTLGSPGSGPSFVTSASERLGEHGLLLNENKSHIVEGFSEAAVLGLRPGAWDLVNVFEFVGTRFRPARSRTGAYFIETFRDAPEREDDGV